MGVGMDRIYDKDIESQGVRYLSTQKGGMFGLGQETRPLLAEGQCVRLAEGQSLLCVHSVRSYAVPFLLT